MFFYKIEGEVPNTATEEDNRKARKLEAHKIAIRTTEFNSSTGDTYCFVSLISDEAATICIITKCVVDPVSLAKIRLFCRYNPAVLVCVRNYAEQYAIAS